MKISVVVDLSSYGVIFSVWISRNKKMIPKIYFYTIQMVWNGRPSWVRALRGRVGLWFVGLSETGFWPPTSRWWTRANRFEPVFWNFPAGHLPRTNSSVETCSIFIRILSFKVFKHFFVSFLKIYLKFQSPFYLPLFWPRAVSPKNVLPLSRIKGMN